MRAHSSLLLSPSPSSFSILHLMRSFFSNFAAGSTSFFILLLLNILVTPVSAQKSQIFQWGFDNTNLGSQLPTCRSFSIKITPYPGKPGTSLGVGPYSMISYEIGGTPRVTPIGSNLSSLSWTVEHPVGTQLALDVVDSEGTAGGIPSFLYTVVAGQTTNCVKGQNSTDFTVHTNITSEVQTCEPWGLRITGGVKPYNVTLLQVNSPNITNVTMGPNDDGFAYIDRATPGSLLIAAVSDLTGQYASGTPTVMPKGSSNVDCIGLNSVSGSAAEMDRLTAQAQAAAAAKARRRRTAIIAGTVVPILVLLIGGIVTWYYFYYRPRRSRPRELDLGPDTTVKPFTESQVLSINSFIIDSTSTTPRSPKSPPGLHAGSIGHSSSPSDGPYNVSDSATASGSVGRTQSASSGPGPRPGFTNFPVRRGQSAKAMEAGTSPSSTQNPQSLPSAVSETSYDQRSHIATTSGSANGAPSRLPTRTTSVGTTVNGEPELIIQHRDGGPGRVRELPPPYADQYQGDS